MQIYVKPCTIQQHVGDFTSQGLPLLTLIESSAPKKEGTPYLFKTAIKRFEGDIGLHKVGYTEEPEALALQLQKEWAINGKLTETLPTYQEITPGEAALLELAERLVEQQLENSEQLSA